MSCNHPYKAFKTGCLTANGKEDFVLVMSSEDCGLNVMYARKKKPINLCRAPHQVMPDGKVYLIDPFPVPCGKCCGCRMDRAREWKDRLVLESSYYRHVYFLTITYDDDHLPPALEKRDLQLFFKRMRKRISLRYFACGEYGDKTHRPHYHAILFMDLPLPLSGIGVNRYHSPLVSECWSVGLHEVSEANASTIAYVAGYCNKKVKDPDWDAYPVKPFIIMSRMPGIARQYLEGRDLFRDSLKIYGDFKGKGFGSSSLPRYFRNTIKDLPQYDEYKNQSVEFSKALMLTNHWLIGPSNEMVGQYKDGCIHQLLAKKRKVKV